MLQQERRTENGVRDEEACRTRDPAHEHRLARLSVSEARLASGARLVRNGASTRFATPIGPVALFWNAAGIARVLLPTLDTPGTDDAVFPGALPPTIAAVIADLQAILAGTPRDLQAAVLDERGLDATRRRIYAATRAIPFGATCTYGELARDAGTNARVVGRAMATNPFPLIVPCHRVIGADGRLVGFSGGDGVATKRQLLAIERAPGFDAPALFAL